MPDRARGISEHIRGNLLISRDFFILRFLEVIRAKFLLRRLVLLYPVVDLPIS
jgi:hypothetical protein